MTNQPSSRTDPPIPRDVPTNVGFAVPHTDLYRATKHLLKDVTRAEEDAREEVAAIRQKLGIAAEYSPTLPVELYTAATLVFAAMTLEAAIDLYIILRFNEEAARTYFAQGPKWSRLQTALAIATGVRPNDDDPIVTIVKAAFAARNALVHPKSNETYIDAKGHATTQRNEDLFPELNGDMARGAVAGLDTFFAGMMRLDSKVIGILDPW